MQQPTAPVRLTSPDPAQNFEPGPVFIRLVALIIDSMVVGVIQVPVTLAASAAIQGSSPIVSMGVNIVLSVAFTMGYYTWFYRNKGASPGKLLFGLRVVDSQTGTFLGWQQTFTREVVGRIADSLTLAIGLIMALFREDKRTLHDLIAGTQVLRVRKER